MHPIPRVKLQLKNQDWCISTFPLSLLHHLLWWSKHSHVQISTVRFILVSFRDSTLHLMEPPERNTSQNSDFLVNASTRILWNHSVWCTIFGVASCHASHCYHLFPLCFLQVMYSQDKHSRPSVVETNTTSLELSLPVNQDYVIQIKPFSEGGEGSSSRQITIPKIAGGTALRHETWKWCLCPFVRHHC